MTERWDDRWVPEDFGLAVFILRGLRRWSQRRLETEAGLPKGQVSRYEAGGEVPSRKTLEKIAAAVGVPRFERVERYLLPSMRPLRLMLEGLTADEGPLAELEGSIWRASQAYAAMLRASAARLLADAGSEMG